MIRETNINIQHGQLVNLTKTNCTVINSKELNLTLDGWVNERV